MEDDKLKSDILLRLRRIEGQVKGIQGMIDKNTCCDDVLVQIAAIRAAINKVGGMILQNYAENCLDIGESEEEKEKVENLVKTINKFLK